jgi:hypothetical protein
VTAYERDERRFIGLVKRLKKSGVNEKVEWKNEDFL